MSKKPAAKLGKKRTASPSEEELQQQRGRQEIPHSTASETVCKLTQNLLVEGQTARCKSAKDNEPFPLSRLWMVHFDPAVGANGAWVCSTCNHPIAQHDAAPAVGITHEGPQHRFIPYDEASAEKMKINLINLWRKYMTVVERQNKTHIPRFVDAVSPDAAQSRRGEDIVHHIYGESGAGKTWASLDVIEAFHRQRTPFTVQYFVVPKLRDDDLDDPYDADGKRDENVYAVRNDSALAILRSKLREPTECTAVLIFDECQALPQLCRGIAASINKMDDYFPHTTFYCYFIGLDYVHKVEEKTRPSFATTGSVSHHFIPVVPSASSDFASKLFRSASASNVDDKYRMFCGGNAAAMVFVADYLKQPGPQDPVAIAKSTILYLVQRNGVLRRPLTSEIALKTVRLLTAGVVLLTAATEAILRCGLVTVDECRALSAPSDGVRETLFSRTPSCAADFAIDGPREEDQQNDSFVTLDIPTRAQDPSDNHGLVSQRVRTVPIPTSNTSRIATLTVNPCYLHYFFALLGRQTYIEMDDRRFEETAMLWVCDRLSAAEHVAASSKQDTLTFRDIFPRAIASNELLAEIVPTGTEVVPLQSKESESLESRCQKLPAGCAQLSKDREKYTDAIWKGSNGGCCGVMQFKGFTRAGGQTRSNTTSTSSTLLPFSTLHNEYMKGGFCCCGQEAEACNCFSLSAGQMINFRKKPKDKKEAENDTEKKKRLDSAIPSSYATIRAEKDFKDAQKASA